MEAENNVTDNEQYRTDLGKCDEKQENNSTQALSTNIAFFGCKKRDEQQKKEAKKRTNKKELV